ncbi:hypothetical protein K503DRAFT_784286 [Rhizopogon vinicolor AM-OR11-026]|uniref:DUF6533 domain-containing protein n=1 Tax=Rhizopogon vinicolor AM-OR11-026 TaxID=1314800 RepID=A0A1B7MVB2_9AGAM|nr:hypothetical protein K503DRAFT_784286 [Rhizopogon vinicolor AM-OR11-026]
MQLQQIKVSRTDKTEGITCENEIISTGSRQARCEIRSTQMVNPSSRVMRPMPARLPPNVQRNNITRWCRMSIVMSNQPEEAVIELYWNNYASVLLLEKEVKYVWKKRWSLMTCLYIVVRYLGLVLALLCGISLGGGLVYMPVTPYVRSYDIAIIIEWGFSVYMLFSEGKSFIAETSSCSTEFASAVVLIWRLYALYKKSKRLLFVLLGLLLPIVAISIVSDVYTYSRRSAFSVVLAAAILVKHLKQRRDIKARPNSSMIMIVQYHIIAFVLNLANQIVKVMLVRGSDFPTSVTTLLELFMDIAPFIIAPRLIISIWDMHAHDNCVHVSKTFADCICWTSLSTSKEDETGSQSRLMFAYFPTRTI